MKRFQVAMSDESFTFGELQEASLSENFSREELENLRYLRVGEQVAVGFIEVVRVH